MDEEIVGDEVVIEDSLESEDSFNSLIKVGDIEWIGHVITSENESKKYQLLKIDKEGNENVMFESAFDTLFPYISLESEQSEGEENNLILEYYGGYPEGGDLTLVSFEGGDESFRAKYGHFWGFIQKLTFKYPNSDEYQVTIETSNDCFNPSKADVWELTEDMKTDILGLKFSSEEDTKFFELKSPINAPCTIIDGTVEPPTLKNDDVQFKKSWILIKLPGGVDAVIQSYDGATISVDYQ